MSTETMTRMVNGDPADGGTSQTPKCPPIPPASTEDEERLRGLIARDIGVRDDAYAETAALECYEAAAVVPGLQALLAHPDLRVRRVGLVVFRAHFELPEYERRWCAERREAEEAAALAARLQVGAPSRLEGRPVPQSAQSMPSVPADTTRIAEAVERARRAFVAGMTDEERTW